MAILSINKSRLQSKMLEPGWKDVYKVISSDERDEIIQESENVILPRLYWLFNRQERNGVVRRNLEPFSPSMLAERMERQYNHPLNDENFRYYDWDFKDTSFILRFEESRVQSTFRDIPVALIIYLIHEGHQMVVAEFKYRFRRNDLNYDRERWEGRYELMDVKYRQ